MSEGSKEYVYPIDQPAATLWYHDHRMDFTGPQVYKGLAGFHLIRDDEEEALAAAHGRARHPADDRRPILRRRTARSTTPRSIPRCAAIRASQPDFMSGVLGDCIPGQWRCLAGAGGDEHALSLPASSTPRTRAATGSRSTRRHGRAVVRADRQRPGLLPRPVAHERIDIGQAERFDVIIDFSAYPVGAQVTLVNQYVDGPIGQVMRFHVVRAAKDDSSVPAQLVEFEPLSRRGCHRHPRVPLRAGRCGRDVDHQRQAVRPAADRRPAATWRATEIWRITSNQDHPFHMHLAHFQVLVAAGAFTASVPAAPGPYDAGWKDTVYVPSSEQVEVIASSTATGASTSSTATTWSTRT